MKLDPDLGDAWAYFYKFELQHGTEVCCEGKKFELGPVLHKFELQHGTEVCCVRKKVELGPVLHKFELQHGTEVVV